MNGEHCGLFPLPSAWLHTRKYSFNTKGGSKDGGIWEQKRYIFKNSEILYINPPFSEITLNVKRLNTSIQRKRLAE